MTKMYMRNGDEFVEVGYEFRGFPANGVWVVEDGKQNCIYEFKDVPKQPTPSLISYMQFSDELMKVIVTEWENRPLNAREISSIACEFFAIKAGAIKIDNELIEN